MVLLEATVVVVDFVIVVGVGVVNVVVVVLFDVTDHIMFSCGD